MKQLPLGMQDHLDSGATTMCYCWRLTRQDNLVLGFTEHDVDLTFEDTIFEASSGFSATAVEHSLGLAVDNLDVDGALSSDTLNEDDLAAGLFDNAKIELFWVNWQNTSQRILITEGTMGEIQRMETAFRAELRSKADKMNQNTGRTYQRYCDTDLGDSRCTVDLENAANKGTGAITSVTNARVFILSGLDSFANDWFSLGKIVFTTGDNSGLTYEIKNHENYNGIVTIELWTRPAATAMATDEFIIYAGCKKDTNTCVTKFNNIVNFQGFPFIPGNDILTAYPVKGQPNQDGKTRWGTTI